MANIRTNQTNIKSYEKDNRQFPLFLGGMNTTGKGLDAYDPLKNGYNRIFFTKMPLFMEKILEEKTKKMRHFLEYGFASIGGLGNLTMDFDQITGGYAGRQFDVATIAKDETTEITMKLYEYAGSPIREYIETWITGISDPLTGHAHYHGAMDASIVNPPVPLSQANHTAEAFYVGTDPTGKSNGIEYACLLTNMMPKGVSYDHFNFESGTHNVTQLDLSFTCVKYQSPQINTIAKALLDKYQLLRDSLDFNSNYTLDDINNLPAKPAFVDWPTK